MTQEERQITRKAMAFDLLCRITDSGKDTFTKNEVEKMIDDCIIADRQKYQGK